jgi:hypothetical protein
MESELTQEILSLRAGDHLCLFYEKDPREQMPALVPFIQDGLSREEQFVYIADDQTVEELEDQLQQSGINVGLLLSTESSKAMIALSMLKVKQETGLLFDYIFP